MMNLSPSASRMALKFRATRGLNAEQIARAKAATSQLEGRDASMRG